MTSSSSCSRFFLFDIINIIDIFVCSSFLEMSCSSHLEMSAFGPRKLTGCRFPGAGGCDGCNGADHDDDARDRFKVIQDVADGQLKPD
ncbi:hypothetical protein [Burkholderia cenocepacia]|uniref:hypothetical protein n=1 Tax=Burkholderia cenocepacia TaxID=95486 RepID=UPI002B25554D|nr:hypothetical protein [Burkholderia cenocepacia]